MHGTNGVFPFRLIPIRLIRGLVLGLGLRHALRHDALRTSVSNNFVHIRRIGIRRNGAEPVRIVRVSNNLGTFRTGCRLTLIIAAVMPVNCQQVFTFAAIYTVRPSSKTATASTEAYQYLGPIGNVLQAGKRLGALWRPVAQTVIAIHEQQGCRRSCARRQCQPAGGPGSYGLRRPCLQSRSSIVLST